MTDANIINKSELARRRGVTPATVTRWIASGRVILDANENVLYSETVTRLAETENPQSRSCERVKNQQKEQRQKDDFQYWFGDPEQPADSQEALSDDAVKTFLGEDDNYPDLVEGIKATTVPTNSGHWESLLNNSKAMKERALALKAAAEYDKTINKLVDRSAVERALFERSRSFRDALLILGKRLAAELAACDNPQDIEKLLEAEHRIMLQQFAALPLVDDLDNSWASRIDLTAPSGD